MCGGRNSLPRNEISSLRRWRQWIPSAGRRASGPNSARRASTDYYLCGRRLAASCLLSVSRLACCCSRASMNWFSSTHFFVLKRDPRSVSSLQNIVTPFLTSVCIPARRAFFRISADGFGGVLFASFAGGEGSTVAGALGAACAFGGGSEKAGAAISKPPRISVRIVEYIIGSPSTIRAECIRARTYTLFPVRQCQRASLPLAGGCAF